MVNNRIKGRNAEDSAVCFLEKNGYTVICKNYYTIFGEIDIIAEQESYIIFFEVKYRKSIKNGYPREAVSKKKQDKIKKTALNYIYENNISDKDFSFDVIEILNNDIIHLKNAFY